MSEKRKKEPSSVDIIVGGTKKKLRHESDTQNCIYQEPEKLKIAVKTPPIASTASTTLEERESAAKSTSHKRLSKQITKCGSNYNAAFEILFNNFPFLRFDLSINGNEQQLALEVDTIKDDCDDNEFNTFLQSAARPICTSIDILGKANQPQLGMKLLTKIQSFVDRQNNKSCKGSSDNIDINLHQDRIKKTTFFYLLIYKAIIGMLGQTLTKQKDIKAEQIMHMLYYEIPIHLNNIRSNSTNILTNSEPHTTMIPPPLDLYQKAISALGKCKQMELVMKILNEMELNERIQMINPQESSTMSSFDNGQHEGFAYKLPIPDEMTYQTALTAAIRCKAYRESINILLHKMKQKAKIRPSILAYNQVLSCISNSGQQFIQNSGDDRYNLAIQILQEMEEDPSIEPLESTYKIILSICAKEGKWDEIIYIKSKMNQSSSTSVTNNTSDNITSSGNGISQSTRRGSVEHIHGRSMIIDATLQSSQERALDYMNTLKQLKKMGTKRPFWFQLGQYSQVLNTNQQDDDRSDEIKSDINFTFGIQIHRNPSENGLSLVFYEQTTNRKLGYMLIRNSVGPQSSLNILSTNEDNDANIDNKHLYTLYSSFMGMYIDEEQRGKSLATKFMSIWLLLCLKCNALPRTEIINKPLLSLILTKFGFIPQQLTSDCDSEGDIDNISDINAGIEVEVCPIANIQDKPQKGHEATNWYPDFAIYSKNIRPGDGCFGEREMRIQRMMITKYPPSPRGKKTFVKTTFDHPLLNFVLNPGSDSNQSTTYDSIKKILQEQIDDVLGGVDDPKARMSSTKDKADPIDCERIKIPVDDVLLRRALFGFLLS